MYHAIIVIKLIIHTLSVRGLGSSTRCLLLNGFSKMPSKECQREKILKLLKNSYLPLEMEVNYIAVHNSFVPKVKSFQNRVSVGSSVDHCGSLYEVRRDYQCIM